MRKNTSPPTSKEEISNYDNVPVALAAKYIGWSSPTLYRALQEGRAPFGFAVANSGSWAYNISPGLLIRYKGGDLQTYRLKEVEEIAVDAIRRLLEERLSAARERLTA